MSTSRTSALCLLALVACNAFYGLDETRPNRDEDDDGVLDKQDNCPTIANPDQMDSNLIDEGGDACAQCPALIGIDLDADLYDDGCDRCLGPGHPKGVPLIDDDGDKLDDRCDPCLDGTSMFEIDFNRNGIGDGCEMCPLPPIGDTDGDGLDDACDDCLKGPPHDEDRDGHDDACDNCPFDPNPDQDSPADPVGSACKRVIDGSLERAVFEPFLVADLFRWNSVAGQWTIAADRASLAGNGQRTLGVRFQGQFRIAMRAHLDASASLRIELETPAKTEACVIDNGMVSFGDEAAPLAITGPLLIELYHSDANIVFQLRCAVTSGATSVELKSNPLTDRVRVTLIGEGPLEIEAVDLVTTVPPSAPNPALTERQVAPQN